MNFVRGTCYVPGLLRFACRADVPADIRRAVCLDYRHASMLSRQPLYTRLCMKFLHEHLVKDCARQVSFLHYKILNSFLPCRKSPSSLHRCTFHCPGSRTSRCHGRWHVP